MTETRDPGLRYTFYVLAKRLPCIEETLKCTYWDLYIAVVLDPLLERVIFPVVLEIIEYNFVAFNSGPLSTEIFISLLSTSKFAAWTAMG